MTSPTSEQISKAENLLQLYFDRTLSREEGKELLSLWKQYPELKKSALANNQVEAALRFCARVEKEPIDFSAIAMHDEERVVPAASSNMSGIRWDELIHWARESKPIEKPLPLPLQASPQIGNDATSPPKAYDRNVTRFPAWLLLVVVAFFLGGVYWEFFRPESSSPGAIGVVSSDERKPFAVMTSYVRNDLEDVEAAFAGTTESIGKPLYAREIQIENGLAELLFYNGTRLVVQGPADLTLLTGNRVFCSEGTFSVTVPVSGHGFEIATPFTTIRDLGTKFLAEIDSDRCGVHVVQGEVEMFRNRNGTRAHEQPRRLRTGEALVRGVKGESRSALPDPKRFISSRRMQELSRNDRKRFYGRQYPDNPAFPTGPVIRFDPNEPLAGAMLHGSALVDGEMPGKKAVKFLIRSDRGEITREGTFESMTIYARIRVGRLDATCNPIVMSSGSEQGGVLWQILPGGELSFGFRTRSHQRATVFNTPIVVTEEIPGRWIDLAVVVDARRKTITQYFEGEIVASEPCDVPSSYSLTGASIGNWLPKDQPIREWNGEIASLLIYDRPLRRDEIDAFFDHHQRLLENEAAHEPEEE